MTALLAGAPATAADGAPRSAASVTDMRVDDMAAALQRTELLQRGEQQLARGDLPAALESFEQAARMLHAADSEMGLIRARLQAGAYREALAFAAHTAGSHLDEPAAAALYAWLLDCGGQQTLARRMASELAARSPDNAVVQGLKRAFETSSAELDELLFAPPQRMAPYATQRDGGAAPPGAARIAASGVLVDGGRSALAPRAALAGARRVWVRNGLGETAAATLAATPAILSTAGLGLLRLDAPLQVDDDESAVRDPFAGSPASLVEYAPSAQARAGWPQLRPGFLGSVQAAGALRRLGIDAPAGLHGGPVFDAAGRLAGIALPGRGADGPMLPISLLRSALPDALPVRPQPASAASPPGMRMPLDQVFERSLRIAVQVIVDGPMPAASGY